jgi:hypothetical protein
MRSRTRPYRSQQGIGDPAGRDLEGDQAGGDVAAVFVEPHSSMLATEAREGMPGNPGCPPHDKGV